MLADILKGTDYALTVFTKAEIDSIELFAKNAKPYLSWRYCQILWTAGVESGGGLVEAEAVGERDAAEDVGSQFVTVEQ
ncbi:MAG: hypothetical protein H0T47_06205, partial [Planctomycetaceae bacterium]|nr:hypothetical protein [Planctomycetaceae bacterium]